MRHSSFNQLQGRSLRGERRAASEKRRREVSQSRRLLMEKLASRELLAADIYGPTESGFVNELLTDESAPINHKTKVSTAGLAETNPATDYWLLSWEDNWVPNEPFGPSIVAATETTELIDDARLVRFQQNLTADEVVQLLGYTQTPELIYPLVSVQLSKRLIPNDPSFFQQYNIHNTGQYGGTAGEDINVIEVWDTRRGNGSVIAIVDDGVDHSHPDLLGNYRADLSFDFNGNDNNPAPVTGDDIHGTAVAGIAAALGNNGNTGGIGGPDGISGVAPEADFAGIRLLGAATTDAQNAAALNHQMQNIDIYNNSWGPVDIGDINAAGQPGPLTLAALQNGAQNGRGGLGSIYVWSAGNGGGVGDNVNYDRYANSRHTIAVGAVTNTGVRAPYSELGASLLVVAPSTGGGATQMFTTDVNGPFGYSTTGYTQLPPASDIFGGTSAAAPAVSGVVALMLEANPNLTARDVQHILVNTARRNHVADPGWVQNGAGLWVNHQYGFGVVNAGPAVAAAATWQSVGPEIVWESTVQNVNLSIPDNNVAGVNVTFGVPDNIKVEYVEILTDTSHTYGGDLVMTLTSPSGTSSQLTALRNYTSNFTFNNTLTTARHWNENSFGNWTLNVADRFAADVGTLNRAAIRVYGYAVDTALPNVTMANVTASEADGTMNFTAVLSQPSATDVTFNAFTFNGTAIAGSDYTAIVNQPFTIPAGQTSVVISVPLLNDGIEEVNKTFSLGLTNFVGADPLVRGAVGTILDDDDPAFYTANPFTSLGSLGTLIQESNNSQVLLITSADVDDLRFSGVQGQKIAAQARPSAANAIITLQIVDGDGNNVGSPVSSPAAGQPAVLAPTMLPSSGTFALRISGNNSTFVTVDLMGGAIRERFYADTSDAAPRAIDSSLLDLGSGRYAAVGSLVVDGTVVPVKTSGSTNFVDISTTGTPLNLGDDEAVTVVTTIGNQLLPAGNIRISNNGMIVAGNTGSPSWNNGTIPNTGFTQFLAPYWDDFLAGGNVYWQQTTIGGVPAVVVQWHQRAHYDLPGSAATFQAQIFGSGGTLVRYVYPDVDFGNASYNNGASATIGYQINPLTFNQFSRNQAVLANNDQIAYVSATDQDVYTVDLSGSVGKKIDVIATGLNGSSLVGVNIELIGPDGISVLATASATPGGYSPTNYTRGILSFTVPAAGVYRVRMNATQSAQYALTVHESLAFDTEPNNLVTGNLRPLSLDVSGYGYVGAADTASPDPVDFYSINLNVDDYLWISTSTPLDGVSPAPLNTLDPSVAIYSPSNTLLVSNNNGAQDGKNGYIRFRALEAGTFKLAVTAESGAGAYVLNVDEWINSIPSDIGLSASSLPENSGANSDIGTLSVVDLDPEDTHTFTLVAGEGDADNASFVIDGTTLRALPDFDFETKSSYSIRVQVADQRGGTHQEVFVIDVVDVNEQPTDIALSATSINENAGGNAVVGVLSTTDQDLGEAHVYTLVSGAGSEDNGAFNINGSNLRATSSFNFEVKNSYNVRIRSTDQGGLIVEKAFVITVNDVNEAPNSLELSPTSLNENMGSNAFVGNFSATDPDTTPQDLSFAFSSGAGGEDNAAFRIVNGNVLEARNNLDFETKNSYSIRVRVRDASNLGFIRVFTINVNDVNDTPTDITLSSNSIPENAGANALVGTLSAADQDAGETFTYAFVAGAGDADNAAFTISGNSLLANSSFDFETKSAYTVRVQVTDGDGATFEKALPIQVTNVNETPTDISLSPSQIAENAGANAVVGTLSTVDPDMGDTFTYAFVSGAGDTDNAAFAISGDSLLANNSFDFETKSAYTVRVRVTDANGATFDKALAVQVTNVNEMPTDIALSANTLVESAVAAANPVAVGSLSTTDVDLGDSHTYQLVTGTGSADNALFQIDGNVLSLVAGAMVDFETKPSYSVRVRSTDAGGLTTEKAFIINVQNRGEVSLIQVNSGATQRSLVTNLRVTFDSAVTVNAGAFVVTRRGAGGGNVPVSFTTALDGQGRTVATITFNAGTFVSGGSLVDGNYDLRIVGSQVIDQLGMQLDGDLNGTQGGDRMFGTAAVDRFFRLFGDTSGDRQVTLAEFNQFRSTFGRVAGDPLYNGDFDFDNNGSIALADFNQFRSRFGSTLSFE